MQVGAEQERVAGNVRCRPAVRPDICGLQDGLDVAAGYRTAPGIGLDQFCPERGLAAPDRDLAELAEPGVVVVTRSSLLSVPVGLGLGGSLQNAHERATGRRTFSW